MQKLLRFLQDELIGSENTFLAWAVLAAMGAIIGIGFYLNSPDLSFHGIAGSRESNVNFEQSVEIRSVHVIPGQRVRKGDLLIELDQSDLDSRIRQIQAQIGKLKAEKSVRDQMNKALGNSGSALPDDPLEVEVRQLESERSHLERQRSHLYVFAEIDGIVGSVYFKRGEKAPAFSPLVTISPESPTFVQGFVHENLRTGVKPGSKVQISSLSNSDASVEGRVVGLGSRFVEMPVRLAPANARSSGIWGREVTVEIPAESGILLGEKVQISPHRSFLSGFVAKASAEREFSATPQPQPVHMPPRLESRTRFEASGAIFLSDLGGYLVVSNDTDNRNSPWLFLLNERGEVEENPLVVPGLEAIKDMESISEDSGFVYFMSSLSAKSKGTLDPDRNLLVRSKRHGRILEPAEILPFGSILRNLLKESRHPLLLSLVEKGLELLEVEAHAVRAGSLFLGIKQPVEASSFLVLKIDGINDLFRNQKGKVEVWKTFSLETADGASHRLSDLAFLGEEAYATTTCRNADCGGLWRLGGRESQPLQLQRFEGSKPEGLAYNPVKRSFFLTFDRGSSGSSFLSVSADGTF